MTYFKRVAELNDDEKRKVSEMTGKLQYYILEGRHIGYMSEQLNVPPYKLEENIFETAYEFIRQIGWRKFIKLLIYKR